MIREGQYFENMQTIIQPYLQSCVKSSFISRSQNEKLHVMRYEAEVPKGLVVISHGFTESAQKFDEVIFYFLQNGFHVVVPEHCGHGESYRLCDDPGMVYVDRWQRYVEDFIAVTKAAKREYPLLPVFLYAHSMGGAIGAAAAVAEPALFDRIVLTSPMIQPLTNPLPYHLAGMVAEIGCLMGFGRKYVPGHGAFPGEERFEDSASTSEERFLWYAKKREADEKLQTSGASFGWLRESMRMCKALMKEAPSKIKVPLLLCQAQLDTFVDLPAQQEFVRRLQENGCDAMLVSYEEAKHEIYLSKDDVMEAYIDQVIAWMKNGISE